MTTDPPSPQPLAPELLSPAGQWDCLHAAIENGADAVYFGLDCGFNARARASNFHIDELPEVIATLHRRHVRGYVTVNTLAFSGELPRLEVILQRIAAAGTDAILVQDFGVARLARQVCRDLPIHASTQMTLTSAETISVASRLGLQRVVLAREMSLKEIRQVCQQTTMPIEVFIHGALCVAYSGQCLTSESLGGRSANRGQCAQACRLPYDLICDDHEQDLGSMRYLLSPQDLAGYSVIPELIAAGVCSLKIEGRLKTPEYVANITAQYRAAIDQAMHQQQVTLSDAAVEQMELSFSRGFSPGWLHGCDHKQLVPGFDSAKRGVLLGKVERKTKQGIVINAARGVARGDGIGFAGGRAEGTQQGGRVYEILQNGSSVQRVSGGRVELRFGRRDLQLELLHVGQQVYKSDDPQLNRKLRKTYAKCDPHYRCRVDFELAAHTGKALQLTARAASGQTVSVTGDHLLPAARNQIATAEMLREKIGRLGGTPYQLGCFIADIQGNPMVPLQWINDLRRRTVAELESQQASRVVDRVVTRDALQSLRRELADSPQPTAPPSSPTLSVLCRHLRQVETAATVGVGRIYVDFHDVRQYPQAIQIARAAGVSLYVGSVRIQKPGEMGLLKVLRRHQPDGILCRNLAALQFCRQEGFAAVADFSLNAANELSVHWLQRHGAALVTPAYDLNREQLFELVAAVPAEWLEVVIHQHMPMFHMEHCVFCAVLSPGTNKTNCGRPCDRHEVRLRDRTGAEHPLHADVACRNTLYNALPQSAAEAVPHLIQNGLRHFRLELLEDTPENTVRLVQIYRELLAGQRDGDSVWRQLRALNRVGVTRGTLETKRNPLAIV